MYRYMILAFLVVGVTACDDRFPEKTADAPPEVQAPVPDVNVGALLLDTRVCNGIETGLRVEATLAEESKSDNVTVKELESARHTISLVTISVEPPYPDHLWIEFTYETNRAFPDSPVVIRMEYLVDDHKLETEARVLGASTRRITNKGVKTLVDIMPAFDKVPATALVSARIEALGMPDDAVAETIDPETATAPPSRTTMILSNPVRVNFEAVENGPTPSP